MSIKNIFNVCIYCVINLLCLTSVIIICEQSNDLNHSLVEENHNALFALIDQFLLDVEIINKQMQLLDNDAVHEDILEQPEDEYALLIQVYDKATKALQQGYFLLALINKYYVHDTKYETIYRYVAQEIFFLKKKIKKVFTRTNVFPGIFHNDVAGVASSSLIVDADIDPAAAIADSKLATISTVGKVANSATTATSSNTVSTIVLRDSSGNFSAGTITASLSGNATTATTATNFSGSLSGDVSGAQSATVVSTVGGKTASDIASATATVDAATNVNTASTLVKRDGTGSFAAQDISMVDAIASGFVSFPTTSSLSVGTIQQNGGRFIHSYGTNNTFVGQNAGNFTMSGTGNNTAIGTSSLAANTTGADNTVVGKSAGAAVTTGSNNVIIGYNIAATTTTGNNNIYIDGNSLNPANESNTIRIGNTQTIAFMQGVSGVSLVGSAVVVTGSGQLGTLLSSKTFKHSIASLYNVSEKIYDLNPVSFIYNSDELGRTRYGLIAEEVEEILPELVIRNENGQPQSVCYEMLPVLLLKELQKQHVVIQTLEQQINAMKIALEINNIIVEN